MNLVRTRFLAACALFAAMTPARSTAQSIPMPDLSTAALPASMAGLARDVMKLYHTPDRDSALDVSFRLQLIEEDYPAAQASLRQLAVLRSAPSSASDQTRALNVQHLILAGAKVEQQQDHVPFAVAYADAFRAIVPRLDNRTASLVVREIDIPANAFRPDLDDAIAAAREKATLTIPEALRLLRAYQVLRSYAEFAPHVQPLIRADDERRYIVESNLRIPTGDGATICAQVVRPRVSPRRLPALLEFTIYADTLNTFREARLTAANDYIAVTGFTRGKLCSDAKPVPYVFDGADAATLIAWIAREPWSDGRVGMYSGSYEGFTQWAAAKHHPPALKAIMPGSAAAPGIDTPMEGNVVWNFVYPWPLYAASNKTLDNAAYNDRARWTRLNREWYTSGRAYHDLEAIDGTPNPVFGEWLGHPDYDAYWQSLIPYAAEFARVNIPVLQTAGYYFGGPGAAQYYFSEHLRYNPKAEHYLVIGPYDHLQGQRGVINALGDTATVLAGYEIDRVARLSIVSDLRYQWFDYVLKGKRKPVLLADRVNYEVVGANVWRHAPSIAAMSDHRLRFYLSAARVGDRYLLARTKQAQDSAVSLSVDFHDRSDVDRIAPGGGVSDTVVDSANAIVFVSNSLKTATDVAGLFEGHLDFMTNKRDFDFSVSLFELTPDGRYIQLPPFQSRASYAANLSRRRLFTPGIAQTLDFRSIRLIGHRMRPGSRLVMVLGVIKNAEQEINYGTGGVVAGETIADADTPLHIAWRTTSYIVLPVNAVNAVAPERHARHR
jgi:uncharacterized protein